MTTGSPSPALDSGMEKAVIDNALRTWVLPEIETRRNAGALPAGFQLWAAQVIFDLESPRPLVRLNEEVKTVMVVRAARACKAGEALTVEDFSEIKEIHLTDLDPNAAHLTMVALKGVWNLAFDFRYNATRIAKLLDAARQFLDCAAFAVEKGHLNAALDNLFSAVELMAKSIILRLPEPKALAARKHSYLARAINLWARLGNVDAKFTDLFNALAESRPSARYLECSLTTDVAGVRARLTLAEEMYAVVRAESPTRKNRLVRPA